MDSDAAVTVENVSKNFILPHLRVGSVKGLFTGWTRTTGGKSKETQHALRDVSFEVQKGEFFGIVGRNGSGKSTMLKILANIYQPTKGKVITRGKLVPFIELGVGFNQELTGRENVYLNGAMLGFSKKEIDAMYADIVSFAELGNFMDQKLKNYSSGMQVRLAFSMATRSEADILLIDEVLAVGDADFQRKCFDYFREIKKSKTTVVFVSHDMNAVREYCDRAMLIDSNRVVKIGSPDEIGKMYTKLFMTEEEKQEDDGTEGKAKRIGDQAATITQVTPNKKTYRADEDPLIGLAVKFKANRDIASNVSVGFLVKNTASASILGINTHELHYKIGNLKKGEIITIDWQMPNVFGDGRYLIDAAITSTDGTINHDWWEEAARFRVYREEYSPYLITPTIEATIKRG